MTATAMKLNWPFGDHTVNLFIQYVCNVVYFPRPMIIYEYN